MLDYEFAKENKIVEITRKDGKKCILSKHSLNDDAIK